MCKSGSILDLFTDEVRSRSDVDVVPSPERNDFTSHVVDFGVSFWNVWVEVSGTCGNGNHPAATVEARSGNSEGNMVIWQEGDTGIWLGVNDHVVTARTGTPRDEGRCILC